MPLAISIFPIWCVLANPMLSTKIDMLIGEIFIMTSAIIISTMDIQSHKLGEAMFDEDDIFCPPSFDEQIYYYESMPLSMMIIVITRML